MFFSFNCLLQLFTHRINARSQFFKVQRPDDVPRFGRPSGVPRHGASEGKVQKTNAHNIVLHKMKKEREKTETETAVRSLMAWNYPIGTRGKMKTLAEAVPT